MREAEPTGEKDTQRERERERERERHLDFFSDDFLTLSWRENDSIQQKLCFGFCIFPGLLIYSSILFL
jgi:hypothetical protein